jgi:predicted HAD superfamily phosphohydrolase YqeG
VGDGVGTDVLAAALFQFTTELFAPIIQAPAEVGIFEVVLKMVVFPYVFGHSAPSFPVF